MRFPFFILFVLSLMFFSCNSQKPTNYAGKGKYFDILTYVREDLANNKRNNCGEEKTVYLNGRHETRKIDTVNWEDELEPLLNSDINYPAWDGKFFVDSAATKFTNPGTMQYFYRSIDKKIPITSMTVNKDSLGRVINVVIQKSVKSFLFSHRQSIEYIPTVGYSLRSEQKTNLFNSVSVNVDIKYNCKR